MTSSTMFQHATKLYEALNAVKGTKTEHGKVIECKRTEVYRSIGISMAYYSVLYRALEDSGCVEQLERGTHGRPSKMMLYYPPVEDTFSIERLTVTRDSDILRQRIDNMERRLDGIDLKTELTQVKRRLDTLESGR